MIIDLKAAFGNRYQIDLDESTVGEPLAERPWMYCIAGQSVGSRGSFISVHSENLLAVWSNRRSIVHALEALPGCKVHQRCDDEIRILFTPDRLEEIASIIRARRVPQFTAEQRCAARERLAPWRFEKSRGASAENAPNSGDEVA
jgi:hypothetical protein